MRSLEDTRQRWRETLVHSATIEDLQRACSHDGPTSPCVTGCRSICWKTFILSHDKAPNGWIQTLRQGRKDYAKARDKLLQFIKHPEALNDLSIDPLADVADSPWNTVREDEIIRAEIQQDVQRLPEEANYHDERMQTLILDILFVYCKSNPAGGGYRQGMHELLAPILHVIDQDALDRAAIGDVPAEDDTMLEMLDSSFVEHDAYVLFSKLMSRAQAFYEVVNREPASATPGGTIRATEQSSAIVERSKFIHDVCLRKVDPELSEHLTAIEILPQIFLIRWIRLLFSREFPFEACMILWDTMFSLDPRLECIDLICVAMLLRIRWQLLEADYSVCLQLLLKYPQPDAKQGPHTFVDDALYLRSHLNIEGGTTLIKKYTGKGPASLKSPGGSRPSTPTFSRFNSFRQRGLGVKSPLATPGQYLQSQGGVEALFQGAAKGAKGVFERGEKLGINQAVRDAVGEIRKNMANFNEARYVPQVSGRLLASESDEQTYVALVHRNRQLAIMLDETVDSLKTLSSQGTEDKSKSRELIEVAAAKIQFVKIHLEDPSMELPRTESKEHVVSNEASDETSGSVLPHPDSFEIQVEPPEVSKTREQAEVQSLTGAISDQASQAVSGPPAVPEKEPAVEASRTASTTQTRPSAPIPTRSTLAQSSFSWMLEPDQSSPASPPTSATKSPPAQFKKRSGNNASREKNAFLFGEVGPEREGSDSLRDNIFGLEPLGKSKSP